MEEQFAPLGLTATRIEAVPNDTIPAALVETYCDPSRRPYIPVRDLGLSLSHLEAMHQLLATDAAHALIFEDDVVLSSRLPGFLAAFEVAPPTLDLLRIETSLAGVRMKRVEQQIAGLRLARPFSWEAGAAGYIVSRSCARLLTSLPEMNYTLFDFVFQPYGVVGHRLKLRQLNPALCIQTQAMHTNSIPNLGSDLSIGEPRWPRARSSLGELMRQTAVIYRREIVHGGQQTFHQLLGAKKHVIPFAP
jgi:glycosyl transferase, family 25